jgi:hypothetical protein
MEGPLMMASQRLERSKAKDWRVASTARARDLRPRVERPVPGRAVVLDRRVTCGERIFHA